MARKQPVNMFAYLLTLLAYQMLSGEGRSIKSLNRGEHNSVKHPSYSGIRKLESLSHKSPYRTISPMIAQKKVSTDLPKAAKTKKSTFSTEPSLSPSSSSLAATSLKGKKIDTNTPANCAESNCLDDIGPTPPGRSPGAGHSYTANTGASNELMKVPQVKNSPAALANDKRRTSPGRSPGTGHALQTDNTESNPKTEEVTNTFPSTIPTKKELTHHAKRDELQPPSKVSTAVVDRLQQSKLKTEASDSCPSEKCINEIGPTAGRSPGAGHYFIDKSHGISSQQVKHLGLAQTDDYRPTNPGKSPGAGHAILKKDKNAH